MSIVKFQNLSHLNESGEILRADICEFLSISAGYLEVSMDRAQIRQVNCNNRMSDKQNNQEVDYATDNG